MRRRLESATEGHRSHPLLERIPLARGRCGTLLALAATVAVAGSGCSLKKMAMGSVANTLSGSGDGSNVFLTDDDPILVGEALPFSLKLMESVLQETPEHEGLLIATASGFVLYAHAWVLQPARVTETMDLTAGREGRARAKSLFLRARGYAGRAIELRRPGLTQELALHPEAAAARLGPKDLPAMYWYAAALGSALSADKNDMELLADLPLVTALLQRALALNETWNDGAIHELMMVVMASQPVGAGGGAEKAEEHFLRAMEINGGRSVGLLVSFAETICVQRQDRERFTDLLQQALAFDANTSPDTRLANLIAQEHARWLLSRADELFIENAEEVQEGLLIHGGLFRWPAH